MPDGLPPEQILPEELIRLVLFSETKDIDDAIAIANVIVNRVKRGGRFGETLEDVIYAPKQFSGVNSKEWKKAQYL